MLNYQYFMQFCLFARFLCFVSFSFALLQLVEKYCIFGRFFGRLERFLAVCVCLSVSTQKAVILAAFAPQFFDAPPAPKRPPPRPRLPFRIIFFENFFFSSATICLPSFKFFFRIFFLVFYLTANSHFRVIAIYFSEYEQGVYLTAI